MHVKISPGLHPFSLGKRVWQTDSGVIDPNKERELWNRGLQLTKRRFGVENISAKKLPDIGRCEQAITACYVLRGNNQDFRVQEYWRDRSDNPYERYVLVILYLSKYTSASGAGKQPL